jgi:LemA protein
MPYYTLIALIAFGLMLLLGLPLYGSIIYNGFVTLRNDIRRSRSNIDVLLKQRHDEIPNLVAVCRGFMEHEQEVLEKVVRARSLYTPGEDVQHTSAADLLLTKALGNLFAVAENYPSLKTNESFLKLQQRITQIENEIADRRELFNDCVNNFNIRREQIPDVFIASLTGLKEHPMWRMSDAERSLDVRRLVKELNL